ncbi:hypothetical protein MTO96_030176 [Rhipicephalus appendiculatus]
MYKKASKGEHEKAEGTSAAATGKAVEPPCEERKVKTATRRRSTFVCDTSKAIKGSDKRGDADKRLCKMPALFEGDTVTSSSRVEPPCTKKPRGCFSAVVCDGSREAKRPATTAFHCHFAPARSSSSLLVSPVPRCSQDGAPPSAEDVEMEDLSDAIGESLSQQVPLSDFKGTYVVSDTNIFLGNLDLLKKIVLPDTGNEDMVLCVPWMAIQELDNMKTKRKAQGDQHLPSHPPNQSRTQAPHQYRDNVAQTESGKREPVPEPFPPQQHLLQGSSPMHAPTPWGVTPFFPWGAAPCSPKPLQPNGRNDPPTNPAGQPDPPQ